MYTNADVTIFNQYTDKKTRMPTYQKTYIKKAFWQESEASIRARTGVSESDRVLVFIPTINQFERKYINPIEFTKTEDKENYFTLQKGDLIVKGNVDPDKDISFEKLSKVYETFVVSSVQRNFYGRPHMQHFKVGGR